MRPVEHAASEIQRVGARPRRSWVVLPAYNEARALPALLGSFVSLARDWRRGSFDSLADLNVIVIDDGSTDGTRSVAGAFTGGLNLTVLTHTQNQGLAAALRTGLEYACARAAPGDVVITMDADNTHQPGQLPALVDAIDRGSGLVVASRYARGASQRGVPIHRSVLSVVVSRLLRLRFRLRGIRDYSCGFRAYRASVLQQALRAYGDRLIVSQGFVAPTELLTKLAPFAESLAEVPLDLRYDSKIGPSKLRVLQTMAAYVRLMIAPSLGRDPGVQRPHVNAVRRRIGTP